MRSFQAGGEWHYQLWREFVVLCGSRSFDPDLCTEVAAAFVSQIDAYATLAERLADEPWDEDLRVQVTAHLQDWPPDDRSRQFLLRQPPEIARIVLENWAPNDPWMNRHDNFAAYYTRLINRTKGGSRGRNPPGSL